MDYAHTETDKRIEELEKRLQAEYRQAYKETKAKLEKYLSDFARKDEAKVETAKQKTIDAYKKLKTAKSETIKEFAEKLKSKASLVEAADYFYAVAVDDIDELMKAETEEVVEVV